MQDCTSRSRGADVPRAWTSIDFWRGVVLCTIFINHIPGNLFEIVTQKNYGFSDSAEAFVFLSGLSLALAYARRFANGQAGTAVGGHRAPGGQALRTSYRAFTRRNGDFRRRCGGHTR